MKIIEVFHNLENYCIFVLLSLLNENLGQVFLRTPVYNSQSLQVCPLSSADATFLAGVSSMGGKEDH